MSLEYADGADGQEGDAPPTGMADLPAERVVLGAMMLNPRICDALAADLRSEDFWRGAHQIVFEAITALRAAGTRADAVNVYGALDRTGQLGRAGGGNYIHTLIEGVAPDSGPYHARLVLDCAARRALVMAGQRTAAAARQADGEDLDATFDFARAQIEDVAARRVADQSAVRVADLLDAALEEVENPTASRRFRTGITDFDGLVTGLEPGRLTVIGARPKIGKSTAGRCLLHGAAKHGTPGLLVSLEMGRGEIMQGLLSDEAQVPLHHIRNGSCDDLEWHKLARAAARLAELPLWIDDTPTMTVAALRHRAVRAKREHGVGIVCVDYLQLLTAPKAENRQVAVSAMSRELKLMARAEDLAVVALAQLNRGPESRADKKPTASDLRESGSLEQDADSVLLLHREDVYERDSPRAGEMDIIVDRQRTGPTGVVTVAFQGHYARIVGFASEEPSGRAA